MKLIRLPRVAAVAAVLALAAAPALAQHEGERHGGEHQGQAQPRGNPQGGQQRGNQQHGNQQRGDQQRGDQQRGNQQRGNQQRGNQQRGNQQPYANRGAQPRAEAPRGTNGRVNGGEYRGDNRGDRGRAVPRVDEYRSRAYAEPRAYGYDRPHADIRVRRYDRPFFAFRPHFQIGYGIYIGYPVPYPVDFGAPTYVYGYPDGGAIAPNSYGGISLDITPDEAQVSVDGAYVGLARDFSPSYQPLTLMPGRHHLELQAPGAEPLAFDVDVAPGQVIPYRGVLQPE